MRYWIYKDTQIMGPFTREDLSQVQGVSGDSLVCPESLMGTKDSEWKGASEISELSGLFAPGSAVAAAPSAELAAGGPPDVFDRLSEQARGSFEGFGYGGEWTSGIFEDPDFFRQWGALVDSATRRVEDFEVAKVRAELFEKTVGELKGQLARYERQQNEILERLGAKDRALDDKERTVESLQRALDAAQAELRLARERAAAPPPAYPPQGYPPPPAYWAPQGFPPPQAFRAEPGPQAYPPPRALPPEAVRPEPAPPSGQPPAQGPAFAPPAGLEAFLPKRQEPPPAPGPATPIAPESAGTAGLGPARPEPFGAPALAASPVPAPVARPRVELPPAMKLKSSTLEMRGLPFAPPLPVGVFPPVEAPAGVPAAAVPEPAPFDAPPAAQEFSSAEPVAFSPQPLEPPATLIQRSPGGEEPAPSFGPMTPLPGSAPVPFNEPAPIPSPEPMPAEPAGSATPVPSATPLPFSLAQTPAPIRLAPPPAAQPAALDALVDLAAGPADSPPPGLPSTATPAPVTGSFEPPRTTMRSIATPVPVTMQGAEALYPQAATPMPALSAAAAAATAPIAAPEPVPAAGPETMKRRRQSKAFLIVLSAAFVGLLVAGVFFLKDPKEVILLFTMGPKKARPVDPDQIAAPPTSLSQVRPMAPPFGGPAPAPASPAPAPGGEPKALPPGRDFVADALPAAIDFAKSWKLGKGRGAVATWLQRSFLPPGGNNEVEWSAGAVEANVYMVSFRAFKGGRAAKLEPITYLFEVNLEKKAIQGRNPAARELLAGGGANAPAPAPKRKRKSRRAAPEPAPEAGDQVVGGEQADGQGTEGLLPPAEDGGAGQEPQLP